MPIGLSTAILGSAAIAGVGGVASSLIGSKNQANAAREAAAIQSAAADRAAQIQLQMYGQTRQDLSPYRAFGASAMPGASALLGFGSASTGATAAPSGGLMNGGYNDTTPSASMLAAANGIPGAFTGGQAAGPNWNAYLAADPGIAQQYGTMSEGKKAAMGVTDLPSFAQWHWQNVGQGEDGRLNPMTGVRVGQTDVDPAYASYFAPAAAQPGATQAAASPAVDPASMQSFLESTPGYQFTRDQGLKAVNNSLYAKGLGGGSGALGKGLARFVTGLADQTYGNQVDRYMKAIGVGADAAKSTGTYATEVGSNVAKTITGGAQAQATGITGAANAGAAGLVGATNAIGQAAQAVPNALITDRVVGMYAPR